VQAHVVDAKYSVVAAKRGNNHDHKRKYPNRFDFIQIARPDTAGRRGCRLPILARGKPNAGAALTNASLIPKIYSQASSQQAVCVHRICATTLLQ
jgi:hypothetical protein